MIVAFGDGDEVDGGEQGEKVGRLERREDNGAETRATSRCVGPADVLEEGGEVGADAKLGRDAVFLLDRLGGVVQEDTFRVEDEDRGVDGSCESEGGGEGGSGVGGRGRGGGGRHGGNTTKSAR